MSQLGRMNARIRTLSMLLCGLMISSACVALQGCDSGSSSDSSKEITLFAFHTADNPGLSEDVTGTISDTDIAVTLPAGSDVSALRPTIVYTGKSLSPDSGEAADFGSPVMYTVTAGDGTTLVYTVHVSVRQAASSAKDITKFSLAGVEGTISGVSIVVTLPFGTDVSSLKPTVSMTGKSLSPDASQERDFSSPVQYTVTAEDGSTKTYTVKVNVAESSAKDITAFKLGGVNGVINGSDISVALPYGTDVTALTPMITHTGASIDPDGSAAEDFSSPVQYKVTAADGSTKTYTVAVTLAASTSKAITGFTINNVNGEIGDSTITLTLPNGTNVSALTPTVKITGQSVSPASGEAKDFTGAVDYTVTAADGSTKTYKVTVHVAESSAKAITAFSINGVDGAITGNDIALTVPFGTDVTALTPAITLTGASVSPASGEAHDFSSPASYTVTAADGSTNSYTVTVSVAANTAKDISSFTVLGRSAQINAAHITLTVPYGSDLASLTPTIVHTGASVSPASGAPQDFSSTVQYTVTAADGSTRTYDVDIVVAANTAKEITAFSINSVSGTISGSSIALSLPFGTDVTALQPNVTHTGASVTPGSGVAQDFTSPVTYRVTAADNSTADYVVTVSVAPSGARSITDFSLLGVHASISGNSITLTLPHDTDLTSLKPDTLVYTGTSISPAADTFEDFSQPVSYTVTAASGQQRTYTVSVNLAASSAKSITQFEVFGIDGTIVSSSIFVTVPYGSDLTSLVPTVQFTGAALNPGSGLAQDFSGGPIMYTVTADDGSTHDYYVTISAAANNAKDITQFSILGNDGNINGTNIAVTVPFGTDVTSLAPSVTHTGASVSPQSNLAQDFTQPVMYTVTAADNSTKIYTVTVDVAANTAKSITQFTLLGIDGTISNHAITLTVPYGTDVTSLAPSISQTGASIAPASGVAQDFSNPVTYTVTAADNSTQDYLVTVLVASSTSKDITQFTVLGVDGTITGTSIALTLPYGTDPTLLIPSVIHTGASVSPNSGAVQDFSSPVVYTVAASDGSTKDYTVVVTIALDSSKDITQFTLFGVDANITGTSIGLTLPFGTDVTSLTPTIIQTGAGVSPAGAQDFSAPVVYTVSAVDGSTKDYTVTVSVAANSAKDITQFTILGMDATITGNSIGVSVPFGTDVTSLVPTIVVSGVSVSPPGGAAQDFSSPVMYTVSAADNSTKTYSVTVSVAPNTAKDITQFTVLGIDATISGTSISLTVPFGTDRTSLVPTITHTGVSVSPNSGAAEDFTSAVTYTVMAADGSTKDYTVTLNVAPSNTKDITEFKVLGVDAAISGTDILLTEPYGTDVTAIAPSITHTGASISPADGVAQDFTNPVMYTVTAADGSTKTYTVTIPVALNSAKDITQFSILGVDGTINNHAIVLTLPFGTSVTSLTPTIVQTGASVSPASGTPLDFSSPVTFTVAAADSSTQDYTVTVSVAPSSAKDITQFSILGVGASSITSNTIALTLPFGTDPTALTPTIVHTGASVSPNSGAVQDFSSPVMYTVTAADSSTKTYTVTVAVALNSAKDITQFSLLGSDATISGTSITFTAPFGTNLASLTPTIVHSGASVSPNSGMSNDFSSPVTYTVTAADGSTKDYTVTVSVALNSAKDITQFTILGVDGNISNNAISLTVPYGSNLTSLTPTITHTGASVSPGDGVSQDFTNPVTYTVTAANGSTKDYSVTVSVALNSAKDITGFDIGSNVGQISGNNISVTVPYGTDVTSLTPTITHTGASTNPASGVAQDFTNPVMYTVTAADNSTQNYTVTVNVALNMAKDITGFSINGNAGSINGTMIDVTVPYGTDVTALAPTIVHTGATVNPADGAPRDFTNPVMYTVTAADSSTQSYTVTVTVAPSMSKDITQFSIAGVNGMIGTNTIDITLPYGTDVTSLTPTIMHSGSSVSPDSGVAHDFSSPAMYTVTAADNSTKLYTVTVTIAANAAAVLSGGPFTHDASVVNGDVIGTIGLTDGDIGQMYTFMITSDTSGTGFAIDAMTGVISVADATALTAGTYTVGVSATDDGVPPATGTLNVTITLATPPMAVADAAATALASVSTTINLAANDTLGSPAATFASFGAGSLGGAVTDHPADGSTVTLAGGTISLDASGSLTVNAATPGVYTFDYRISNGMTSDATVTLTICTNMSVGSIVIARPEDQPIACFGTTENVTSQYVFVPMNLTSSASYSITATVSGATGIMGGVAPSTGPTSATDTPHSSFRASEHTEVATRSGIPGGGSGTPVTPAASIPTGVPNVGDSWSLNIDVSTACATGTATTATVKYVGTYSIIVADTVNMPAGGFTDQQYQVIAWNFDNLIYPSVTAALGAPTDHDNNARVVLFVTPAMNALSPPASSTAIYAREMPRDLLSQTDCPTSNAGEIIYLLAPDPTGEINSNVRTVSLVGGNDSAGLLSHEFAHLILDGRRLANGAAFEEPWLDEAFAGMAEDLSFFVGSGWGLATVGSGTASFPTTNSAGMTEGANVALGTNATSGVQLNSKRVASFNAFENPLYTRYKAWVQAPRSVGIIGPTSDTIAQRGSSYMFLRYLDDRLSAGTYATGNMFLSSLVDSNLTGMTNISAGINADANLWLRDYLLAIYIDDSAIANLDVAMSAYRIASWNWRSLGGALGGYLQDAVFTDLTPVTFNLAGDGTATYTRFAVASGGTATLSLTPPMGTWDAWYAVFRRQ